MSAIFLIVGFIGLGILVLKMSKSLFEINPFGKAKYLPGFGYFTMMVGVGSQKPESYMILVGGLALIAIGGLLLLFKTKETAE